MRVWAAIAAGCAAAALAAPITAGPVRYVDDDAPPGGDGSSWAAAMRFLQTAMVGAAPGTEIRIAQGTYRPDRHEGAPGGSGNPLATFQLGSDMVLRGGYAGPGAPDPNARDVAAYPTILDGDIDGDGLPDADNSRHVVTMSATLATLDGLTITAGSAGISGGGGVLQDDGTLVLLDCTLTANHGVPGAAIASTGVGTGLELHRCAVTDNQGNNEGIAIHKFGRDRPAERLSGYRQRAAGRRLPGRALRPLCHRDDHRLDVLDNMAGEGGAIFAQDATVTVSGSTFEANESTLSKDGGAISVRQNVLLTLQDSVFLDNIGRHGGAVYVHTDSHADVTGCVFSGNLSLAQGGAIAASDAAIADSLFDANNADHGGAIMLFNGAVTGCTFTGNDALDFGGAVRLDGNAAVEPLVVSDCTFIANDARDGGGIAVTGFGTEARIARCLFDGCTALHGAALAGVNAEGETILQDCTLRGNIATIHGGGVAVEQGALVMVNGLVVGNSALLEDGGGLWISGGGAALINATVFQNSAPMALGGGLADVSGGAATLTIDNSIVWANADSAGMGLASQVNPPGGVALNFTTVMGLGAEVLGLGNIEADPLFVDADGADDNPATFGDNDYTLSERSPCIDAAANGAVPPGVELDLAGAPRFVDRPASADCPQAPGYCGSAPLVDMGPYEHQPDACLQILSQQAVCHPDTSTVTYIVTGFSPCTGSVVQLTFTASGGGDPCFNTIINDEQGGFCCVTSICIELPDCNGNGIPDGCDIDLGTSADCNGNGVPDECDILDGSDCNANGVPDECDVTAGSSQDVNANSVPDECECLGDLDGDGAVATDDLLVLLANWGPVPASHPADFNSDGVVGTLELLALLSGWGPCP